MNRKETSLLVEGWRKLISEDVYNVRAMPGTGDRQMMPSMVSKDQIRSTSSKAEVMKLMSASTGFFGTLVDSIRFGFLTREEVNRICDALSSGCEDNFRSLPTTHACLKYWKTEVSRLVDRVDDEFKAAFCESIKSNCEMVKNNYSKAYGNIKQLSI